MLGNDKERYIIGGRKSDSHRERERERDRERDRESVRERAR